MKNLITLCLIATICFTACNNETNKTENQNTTTEKTATKDAVSNPQNTSKTVDVATLISSSDCSACHQESTKLVGPSWVEIAQKYSNADIEKLTTTIIEGGSGNWGEMQMTPHPTLSRDDAKLMVEYILAKK